MLFMSIYTYDPEYRNEILIPYAASNPKHRPCHHAMTKPSPGSISARPPIPTGVAPVQAKFTSQRHSGVLNRFHAYSLQFGDFSSVHTPFDQSGDLAFGKCYFRR